MKTKFFIGTSGWHFAHWRERFYPKKMPSKEWLRFYAESFDTVESNSSFYRLLPKKTYQNWSDQVGKSFVFAVKFNRNLTHNKRLIIDEESSERLKASLEHAKVLGKNLGPILVQLPPSLKLNLGRLEKFLKEIRRLDKKLFASRLLVGIEFRHASWQDETVFELLEKYNAAYCISDSNEWPTRIIKTADWAYVRLHGRPELFSTLYSLQELREWRRKINSLHVKRVYVYFNNDDKAHAIDNALMFKKMLSSAARGKVHNV